MRTPATCHAAKVVLHPIRTLLTSFSHSVSSIKLYTRPNASDFRVSCVAWPTPCLLAGHRQFPTPLSINLKIQLPYLFSRRIFLFPPSELRHIADAVCHKAPRIGFAWRDLWVVLSGRMRSNAPTLTLALVCL